MNINLNKTLQEINRKLAGEKGISKDELYKAYDLVIKLRSQLIGAIYYCESYTTAVEFVNQLYGKPVQPKLAEILTDGITGDDTVTLTIREPLPSLKEMTSAMQDHWLELIHTAIAKAKQQQSLPRFEKAFVWIEITTPRGSDNPKLWDISNKAINLILNNLKGVFFEDDNLEHMAFGAAGKWGEEGVTVIHILPFDRLAQIGLGGFKGIPCAFQKPMGKQKMKRFVSAIRSYLSSLFMLFKIGRHGGSTLSEGFREDEPR